MAKRVVTAIDVGTTKVATIVAKVDNSGGIQVLGSGVVPSHGLHKGMVVNPEEEIHCGISTTCRAGIGRAG